MLIAIVGGGLAGALLAWRLRRAPGVSVEIFTGGRPTTADATGASGGLVRGYEPDPDACLEAAESLAELRDSPTLCDWSGYREIGSVYLLPACSPVRAPESGGSVQIVQRMLPGSVKVLATAELTARYPFRELPEGTVGVAERHAGYLSPARLRAAVLTELAAAGVPIRPLRVAGVTPGSAGLDELAGGGTPPIRPLRATPHPAVRLTDGSALGYDAVVVAAGAWTPRLLAASGLPARGYRTKHIQYSLHTAGPPGLGAFVDDTTGLYGRPAEGGSFLLGLPSTRWDANPDAVVPDQLLAARAMACAGRMLTVPITPYPAPRTVAAFDCYHSTPGLRLRRVGPTGAALFTFTGGSGGAAKTVLAVSRAAAGAVLRPRRVEVAR